MPNKTRRKKSMSRLTQHDRKLLAQNPVGIIGVDEAGRGCLAGPVSAAAVWLDMRIFATRDSRRLARRANDSKKLSPETRDELFAAIEAWKREGIVRVEQAYADVLEIDAYNILGATRLAMHRCLLALANAAVAANEPNPLADSSAGSEDTPLLAGDNIARPFVLVDGRPLKPFAWRHTALVGGDARSLAIALASIYAKISRDRLMENLPCAIPPTTSPPTRATPPQPTSPQSAPTAPRPNTALYSCAALSNNRQTPPSKRNLHSREASAVCPAETLANVGQAFLPVIRETSAFSFTPLRDEKCLHFYWA
jgi:ribonuclease HII